MATLLLGEEDESDPFWGSIRPPRFSRVRGLLLVRDAAIRAPATWPSHLSINHVAVYAGNGNVVSHGHESGAPSIRWTTAPLEGSE